MREEGGKVRERREGAEREGGRGEGGGGRGAERGGLDHNVVKDGVKKAHAFAQLVVRAP